MKRVGDQRRVRRLEAAATRSRRKERASCFAPGNALVFAFATRRLQIDSTPPSVAQPRRETVAAGSTESGEEATTSRRWQTR